jgi:hypothetical protein
MGRDQGEGQSSEITVLRIRIWDPVLFLNFGSGIRDGKKIQSQDQLSGMRIPDLIFENLVYQFFLPKILKFFDVDTNPGSCQPWIRYLGYLALCVTSRYQKSFWVEKM